jgi:hypothetical protein
MNYIKQLNAFYKLIQVNSVSSNAQCLYCYLLAVNNELSWVETFTKSNFVVCGVTQLSRQAMDRARNELKTKGFIEYEKGTSNQAGRYKIKKLYDEKLSVDFDTPDDALCIKTDTQNALPVDFVTQDDTQRGADCSFCYTDVTQNDTQSGHTVTTLNKQETINSVYLSLIKKAHENFEVTNNAQRVYAYNWCKQQPEYAQLDTEHYMKLYNAL